MPTAQSLNTKEFTVKSTAFLNGRIYQTGQGSVAGAVGVTDGRIAAIGEDTNVLEALGSQAEVVDMDGGLLSPSFGDSHLHPTMGGLELSQCHLEGATSAEHCIRLIAEYAARHPNLLWIVGGGWSLDLFAGGTPHKSMLDHIVPDRPVLLRNSDHHGAWVNSRALELAGITAHTSDPVDGRIERDPDGSPSGTLHEGAVILLMDVAPTPTSKELYEATLRGQEHCLSLGITHWQDALLRKFGPDVDGMAVYTDAVAAGTLTARVNGALWWDRTRGLDQIDELVARRAAASGCGDLFRADSVKIMVDGIAENFTASLSRPYRDKCGHVTNNFGLSFIDRNLLGEIVAIVDRHGFQAHFHALGDQAVTDALDAVEHARQVNGDSGIRHHLAHLQVVRPEDVTRFAEVGAIANIQPLWARFEPQMTELTIPFIDPELAGWQYPFNDLHGAGAHLAAGSDWPVSSANPLEGIHVAVTRTAEHSPKETDPFLPQQRISLITAWDAYTSGVAYLNGREHDIGRIHLGYHADLVLLNRDPFGGEAHEIANTEVVGTWFAGRNVFAGAETM